MKAAWFALLLTLGSGQLAYADEAQEHYTLGVSLKQSGRHAEAAQELEKAVAALGRRLSSAKMKYAVLARLMGLFGGTAADGSNDGPSPLPFDKTSSLFLHFVSSFGSP